MSGTAECRTHIECGEQRSKVHNQCIDSRQNLVRNYYRFRDKNDKWPFSMSFVYKADTEVNTSPLGLMNAANA